ncbi:FAD-binding oxidoreductase [Streptomyces sp. 549]|uniref:FAD-binding oxidoreductase n=1 Tax=Streptomyces sp. 549 TaxID=3049076 RepID=UPI0024C324D5|nr:FAD-binding oxidoreductase [Streptomyces sp. 549]MDK1475350.1 FAD-binding oxidoreductase [Streptomyces sp. 549]
MSLLDVTDTALAGLRADLTGQALTPGDTGYDEARTIFNAMIDRRPSVIAQCADPRDVARAIRFGRDQGLTIAVRGGGHSVAGMSLTEGGLVIDLRRMNDVRVDPEARTARVAGGAVMGDLDRAAQSHGLGTTGGRVSTTGVAGFALGGGSGWLERRFGLACDNLLSAEVVTADGRQLTANADKNPDLFWALHGGGGNFGVVTSLTLALHPVGTVTVALFLLPVAAGPEVVQAYRAFIDGAPDEVGGGAIYLTGPPDPFVPEDLVGKVACGLLVTYLGGERDAREVLEPLTRDGFEPSMVAEMPYAELQSMLDDPPGMRNYWSAEYLDALPDKAVELYCARGAAIPSPTASQHALFPQGGAVARGPADFPVPWRSAAWVVHPFTLWEDPAEDDHARAWARGAVAEMQPWSSGAVYLNFIGQEGRDRVVDGFGEENYRRLAKIKAQYDPDNTFRLNHNIRPDV